MIRLFALVCLACSLVLGAASFAAAADAGLTDEDRADLAWLAGLGYPSVQGKPLVRAVQDGEKNVMGWEVRGFVLAESANEVHLLSLGLGDYRIQRSSPGTPQERRIRFERLDAEEACATWLAGGPSPTAPTWEWWRADTEPSVATQILVFASALAQSPHRRRQVPRPALLLVLRAVRAGAVDVVERRCEIARAVPDLQALVGERAEREVGSR